MSQTLLASIKGDYRDKNYLEWSPINEEQAVTPSVASKESKPGPEPKKLKNVMLNWLEKRLVRT